MHITSEIIDRLRLDFGEPETARFRIPVDLKEYERIKSSQKGGRNHDVTLYIVKDGRIVVIAKHFYPPGMYRAPSGGIGRGEDFIEGARREAREETGCEIELEKFLLISEVSFELVPRDGRVIDWVSYVFRARYISGDFDFTDKREIKEVRLADLSEFEGFGRIMRRQPIGGLHYRAALHDKVIRHIEL
ncbi:MAG: NUDIX hydrolase [Candidatus Zixiibacteriota bacterium]|nr:MAG: NUDIX hydrolase [candidate division Zixibacteria bacterium]